MRFDRTRLQVCGYLYETLSGQDRFFVCKKDPGAPKSTVAIVSRTHADVQDPLKQKFTQSHVWASHPRLNLYVLKDFVLQNKRWLKHANKSTVLPWQKFYYYGPASLA